MLAYVGTSSAQCTFVVKTSSSFVNKLDGVIFKLMVTQTHCCHKTKLQLCEEHNRRLCQYI